MVGEVRPALQLVHEPASGELFEPPGLLRDLERAELEHLLGEAGLRALRVDLCDGGAEAVELAQEVGVGALRHRLEGDLLDDVERAHGEGAGEDGGDVDGALGAEHLLLGLEPALDLERRLEMREHVSLIVPTEALLVERDALALEPGDDPVARPRFEQPAGELVEEGGMGVAEAAHFAAMLEWELGDAHHARHHSDRVGAGASRCGWHHVPLIQQKSRGPAAACRRSPASLIVRE